MKTRRQNGFTLLEVLVALVILALTMSGLVSSIGDGANIQNALEERTFAQWIALNQIAKMQLSESAAQSGSSSGTEEMAGRVWQWQRRIEKTTDPLVNRIIITAGREGQPSELARVVGYLLVKDE